MSKRWTPTEAQQEMWEQAEVHTTHVMTYRPSYRVEIEIAPWEDAESILEQLAPMWDVELPRAYEGTAGCAWLPNGGYVSDPPHPLDDCDWRVVAVHPEGSVT